MLFIFLIVVSTLNLTIVVYLTIHKWISPDSNISVFKISQITATVVTMLNLWCLSLPVFRRLSCR